MVFRTLMRKETFFVLNRLLLLSIVACSTIIPLLYLPQIIQPAIQVQLMPVFSETENQLQVLPIVTNEVDRVTVTLPKDSPDATPSRTRTYKVGQLLQYVYLAGMLISFLILIYGLVTVILLIRKAQVMQMDGFRLFIIHHEIPSFSFGRFVIISKSDYDAHRQTILAHEQAHIRLNHFYDLLLLEMAKIFHWFNPVIYWLIRDMKEIHEFHADDYTLTKGIDATKYQLLIIQKCVGPQRFALANSFNHCQIKKRIIMMNKQKTSKARRWKVATFLPLLALLLMAFGKTGENVTNENVTQKTATPPEIVQNQNEQTSRLIEIKKDGNYIDNKMCTLEEIVTIGQEWGKASNDWIHIRIDQSIPDNRIDEVREALENAKVYHVTQSSVNSDEIIYPAGDVTESAKFTQGSWDNWVKTQMTHFSGGKNNELEYRMKVNFIIDKNGKVRDAHIVKGCEYTEINAAMEKVLTQIPDWEPAKRGNEAVSVLASFSGGVKIYKSVVEKK
jgi:hypothetical protein